MNMRVFEELDVMAGDADSVRPLNDVLATLDMPVRENDKVHIIDPLLCDKWKIEG